jgi:hypothetical protein
MADEALFAVENFPTVSTLGFSFLKLGLVEGLDELVAELGLPAAVRVVKAATEKRTPASVASLSYLECLAVSASSVQRSLYVAAAGVT